MTQPSIKRRFDRCFVKTLNNLLENYKIVYPAPKDSPFHFTAIDELGTKHTRVEVGELNEAVKEAMEEFKKNCPPNTICEARIFGKHARTGTRITV